MPVRPPLEIRLDLIDTIVASGISLYEATRIADSVISPSGHIQGPPFTYEGLMNALARTHQTLFNQSISEALEAIRLSGMTPVLPPGFDLIEQVQEAPAYTDTRRSPLGKKPMWEGGPPTPGWLVPRMILARRSTDLLYVVIGVYDKVHLKRMPGPPPEGIITEYRNLHQEWKATEYLLCDDCRYNELSETICEDCAKRRPRRTGCDRWDLPKFCTESFDDQLALPPTRFEREPVI
jgi:hypothetical protein